LIITEAAVTGGASFTYNFSGQRVQKTEGGVTTYYFFGNYEEEYQGGTLTKSIKYYFANGQRVAQYSSADGLSYY
jgi:hypothetical protein